MSNSLEEIFSDESFDDLTKQEVKKKVEKLDPEIVKFQEIIEFVNQNGREPQKTAEWSNERALWARLQGFRDKKERADKVRKYDNLNLLDKASDFPNELRLESSETNQVNSINDILDDEDLLDDFDGLLDISRYKKTINAADKKSSRKHASNFEQYRVLFEQVHADIASGKRKMIPFEQYDISAGKFYVQNGVMLYVVSIGEFFFDKHGDENAKMHVVYENGTENKSLLFRSLSASLYSKERHGRMVTDIVDDQMIAEGFGEEFTTGYIYVLKSLSTNPEIQKLDNLYKIGFTRNDIQSRISNATKEITYLQAPVKVVLSAEVKNINAQILERTLHHEFQGLSKVEFENEEYRKATEWYIVPLDEIENKINKILTNVQK